MEKDAKQKTTNVLKITIGILCIAVLGLGTWIFIETKANKKTETVLVNEKDRLVEELTSLKNEYATLQTNNDSISNALVGEQEKIDLLLTKVKQTEASNLEKIRSYEKELGTLRAIMKSYIVQIDSLNTKNQQLVAENTKIKEDAKATTQKYEEVSQKAEELSTKVVEGSQLKARGMTLTAVTKKDKDTERASRTKNLKACVTLIENAIAEKGTKTIYIRVKGPDGAILTTSENNLFTVNGEQIVYSAARELDYQGEEIDICIYYDFGETKVAKGVYEVTAYCNGRIISSAQMRLK